MRRPYARTVAIVSSGKVGKTSSCHYRRENDYSEAQDVREKRSVQVASYFFSFLCTRGLYAETREAI